MSKKYNLSETQIRHLACICYREQGTNLDGVKACASHMCNYYEKYQSKNFKSVYECTFGSGWYWSKDKNDEWVREHPSVPADVVEAVRDVIANGNRTLPDYVDEYDCLSDVALVINDGIVHTREREKSYVLNRHNYHRDKTIIQNIYAEGAGDRYTFYCFPDGADGYCDAFGYLYKPKSAEEEPILESIPADPVENAVSWMEITASRKTVRYGSKGSDVLLLQKILNKKSYRGYNGKPLEEDGEFGTNTLTAVRAFQRDNGLEVDGIVGKMTWSALTR